MRAHLYMRTGERAVMLARPLMGLMLLVGFLHPARVADSHAKATGSCRRWRIKAYLFAAAFFAAQRFLRAAMMLALPSALSTRFFLARFTGFGASVLDPAHLFRCASAIAFLPAALIPLFLGASVAARPSPFLSARSSAICSTMRRFWLSKPSIAAIIIPCDSCFIC